MTRLVPWTRTCELLLCYRPQENTVCNSCNDNYCVNLFQTYHMAVVVVWTNQWREQVGLISRSGPLILSYVICGWYRCRTRAINGVWTAYTTWLWPAYDSTMVCKQRTTHTAGTWNELLCCCMPYCTTESFAPGLGTWLHHQLWMEMGQTTPKKWTPQRQASCSRGNRRSLLTFQTNTCLKLMQYRRVLTATQCIIWKLRWSVLPV